MDKVAYFFRCDFRLHSPRERNCKGNKFGLNHEGLNALTQDVISLFFFDLQILLH